MDWIEVIWIILYVILAVGAVRLIGWGVDKLERRNLLKLLKSERSQRRPS
jgi:hypothetical protein